MTSALSSSYVPRAAHLRLPRVCVAVIGTDATDMVERADALVRDNPFIEFRLDYLAKPALALPKIKRFIDYNPHSICIATCRRVPSGGKFKGTVAAQLDILAKAAAAGCQIVDVELQTAVRCKPAQLASLRSRASLILS